MNKYYVYVYLDPRKPGLFRFNDLVFEFEPFYVGKGSGARFKSHLVSKRKHHKTNIINKIRLAQMEPLILKINECLSEAEALDIESKTITAIGTLSKIENVPTGPLCNLKIDGNCQKYSDESKSKMSIVAKARIRRNHSDETKSKMARIALMRSDDEKQRIANLISIANKGRPKSEEHSERMSKLHKGKVLSEETKNKISKGMLGRKTSEHTSRMLSHQQKKEWKILYEETNDIHVICDLHQWCSDNNVSYTTIHGTFARNKFHKGYKIIGKAGGNH